MPHLMGLPPARRPRWRRRAKPCEPDGSTRALRTGVYGIVVAVGAAALPFPSGAQQAGSLHPGAVLAHRWCAGCHRIDERGSGASFALPPSFPEIARDEKLTVESLRAWISTSHTMMPNFRLSAREREELAAYILSFRTTAPATTR